MNVKHMDAKKPTIGIIGAGAFGLAIASICAKTQPVVVYTIEADVYASFQKTRTTKYTRKKLSKNIHMTTDINELSNLNMLFVCTPTTALQSICKQMPATNALFIVTSKGLGKNGELPLELFSKKRTTYMSGPTLAAELSDQLYATIACTKKEERLLGKLPGFVFEFTQNKQAVQKLSVFKNAFAFLIGVCEATKVSHNHQGILFATMFEAFCKKHKIPARVAHSYAGLADCYTTSISQTSRNKKAGLYFGKSRTIPENMTVESQFLFRKLKKSIFPPSFHSLILSLRTAKSIAKKRTIIENWCKNGTSR
ncbi:MAG: NAD(P)-binding domain-containing protein [Candidatus Woesearchaeota archaeon]